MDIVVILFSKIYVCFEGIYLNFFIKRFVGMLMVRILFNDRFRELFFFKEEIVK